MINNGRMKSISYIHHPMVSSTRGIFRTYSPLIPYISPTLLVAESGDVHFLLLHEFCKILLQMANSSILISRLTSFRNDNFTENSKLKAFADDNSKFDENDKVLQAGRKHWEKEILLVTSNFSFSQSAFKSLVLHTCKIYGLLGKELKLIQYNLYSETTQGK